MTTIAETSPSPVSLPEPPIDALQPQGRDLVARATDAGSGKVDTGAMARWVADAKQSDPEAAAQGRAAIENQLIAQGRIGDLSRFNEDMRAAEAPASSHGLPGTLIEVGRQASREGRGLLAEGAALAGKGTQTLIDNPILVKQWESTRSAWTQKGGFTRPLQTVLTNEGIQIEPKVNPAPTGSLSRSSGTPAAVANNVNGALARDAIAAREAAAGHVVDTEVKVNGGKRVVDVRIDKPAADPRMSERLDIESKARRAGSTEFARNQALEDGKTLRANDAARKTGLAMEEAGQALSRTGRVLNTVGRVARPVGVVLGVIEVGQSFHADGNRIGENTGRSLSGVGGGVAGAMGGAAIGAAIGSAVPVVGTVIGGVVGAVIGGMGGDAAGRGLFNMVKSWF